MNKKMCKKTGLVLLLSSFYTIPAQAVDGVALISGRGDDANMVALALHWNWEKRWFTEGNWSLGGYWELDGSYWKGDGPPPEKNIYGAGITPVFRFERAAIGGISPYVEGGIGVHYFSTTTITGSEKLGTNFEFGDHLGAGMRFGERLQYDLTYRYQHYSNGGLSDDNTGVNFNQLRLGYSF